jgi:hypothetical protein
MDRRMRECVPFYDVPTCHMCESAFTTFMLSAWILLKEQRVQPSSENQSLEEKNPNTQAVAPNNTPALVTTGHVRLRVSK